MQQPEFNRSTPPSRIARGGVLALVCILSIGVGRAVAAPSTSDEPAAQAAEPTREPVATSTPADLERIRQVLSGAQDILVHDTAGPLSALLHDDGSQSKRLVDACARADTLLSKAEGWLAGAKNVNCRELRARAVLLRSFERMFKALGESPVGRPATTQEATDGVIAACGDLAEYLDDAEPRIADSARLWLVEAYRRAGKTERVLRIARPMDKPPAEGSMAVFTRLARCRALSDEGRYSAALALCGRVAAGVESWLRDTDETQRSAARSLVLTTRLGILQRWAEALSKIGDASAAEVVAKQIEAVRANLKQDPKPIRFELTESIAGLTDPTGLDAKSTATSQSADEPAKTTNERK